MRRLSRSYRRSGYILQWLTMQDRSAPLPNSKPAKQNSPVPMTTTETPQLRRNRPGTGRSHLFSWTPYESISDIDTTFANQEFIQQMVRQYTTGAKKMSIDRLIRVPVYHTEVSADDASPDEVERDAWVYEQFRQFLIELNAYVLFLRRRCTKEDHPEMKISIDARRAYGDPTISADEDEDLTFLCAAFDPPEKVSAMDYMVHSINQATEELNDPKVFPNRISMSKKGMKEIKKHARRIYRIFAYSYFMLNPQFHEIESVTHLCERYTRFCTRYKLMSSSMFLIPPEIFEDMDGTRSKKKKKKKKGKKSQE